MPTVKACTRVLRQGCKDCLPRLENGVDLCLPLQDAKPCESTRACFAAAALLPEYEELGRALPIGKLLSIEADHGRQTAHSAQTQVAAHDLHRKAGDGKSFTAQQTSRLVRS